MKFSVIDPATGKYPDLGTVATTEEWAKGLMWCDMEGFALLEDGTLMLADECGNFRYPPEGRFRIESTDPDRIERAARRIYAEYGHAMPWEHADEAYRDHCRKLAAAALREDGN